MLDMEILQGYAKFLFWALWACLVAHISAGIYLVKFHNRNTRTRCEICSQLTINIPERRYLRSSGVFVVNSEHISHLVFLLLTLSR